MKKILSLALFVAAASAKTSGTPEIPQKWYACGDATLPFEATSAIVEPEEKYQSPPEDLVMTVCGTFKTDVEVAGTVVGAGFQFLAGEEHSADSYTGGDFARVKKVEAGKEFCQKIPFHYPMSDRGTYTFDFKINDKNQKDIGCVSVEATRPL